MESLPAVHEVPSVRKLTLSRLAIVLTVVLWLAYIFSIIIRQLIEGPGSYHFTMEAFSYAFVVSMLTFSSLMYLLARHGALERFRAHVRVPRALLDAHFSSHKGSITVLVPSYNEEYEVIRKTLLSAALQEYPDKRVVLLVDDPPNPSEHQKMAKLEKTRTIGRDIEALLSEPRKRFSRALAAFEKVQGRSRKVSKRQLETLADEYAWGATWLEGMAKREKIEDHVDVFFVDQVLRDLAEDFRMVSEALEMAALEGAMLHVARVRQLYSRLAWIFKAEMVVFERKQYASLSHEANKAMNLNAYIGLMGGSYKEEVTPGGVVLVPSRSKKEADLVVPDSEFLLTLDADSILLKDYCLRLVYLLEQKEHANVAVTQTPYSSFRGAFSRIERLSGATTDIQHILHQGMTAYGATFWVGANAVIRKAALEDIVERDMERGFEIKRYIQDRTVIEDTESSIDLGVHGWKLVNYPERLSYSATPPDFGSLVVQRRRWANGGLLILPKLWEQIRHRQRKHEVFSRAELLLRLNYMASIAWASFGLLFLLAYPYDGRLLSPLVLLAATPYFITMAYDLKYCGYKYGDIFRIYGFNLILLPVNLAGVLKSIEQALTGKKLAFARTPKVKNRTSAGLPYVVIPVLIVAFSWFTVWRNVAGETVNWGNAIFAAFNAVAAMYAIVAYIGVGNMLADIWLGLTDWLYVEDQVPVEQDSSKALGFSWQSVLYHGEADRQVPHGSLKGVIVN